MDIAASRGTTLVTCVTLLAMISRSHCCADEYSPLGPMETASLERALYDRLPMYVLGIWPLTEQLVRAQRPADNHIAERAVWLERILADEVKPTGVRYGSDQWIMVPDMRWNSDFILGRFASQDKHLQGNVEFQASPMQITLAFHADDLFSTDGVSDARVREMVCRVLKIPGEHIDELRVEKQLARLGDNGTKVCYGKILWNWDPTASWPADKNREWWSHIPFWIADGKLCVSVTTFDWKQDDRPQVERNRFREITAPNPKGYLSNPTRPADQ